MMVWKMFLLFQGFILRFHVNLARCNQSFFSQRKTHRFHIQKTHGILWIYPTGRRMPRGKFEGLVRDRGIMGPYWVSDKIRYDQSSIERVVGLPLLQNR